MPRTKHQSQCIKCKKNFPQQSMTDTNADEKICIPCAIANNFCEICGSTGENPDIQVHYDDMCFQ